jgi:hypothetical protein
VLGAPAGRGAPASPSRSSPVTISDRDDSPVLMDIRIAELRRLRSGRLRLEMRTYEPWSNSVLLPGSGGGPPGTICLLTWTAHSPAAHRPDFLVCATPRASGRTLRGTVLRERSGPPQRVGTATVTRPNSTTVRLAFSPRRIGSPRTLRFAVEAAQPAGCPRPRGCVDRAPNGAATRAFTVR